MTAPAYLSDDQVERLSELLERRAVPAQGFNLEALDGYLSALVVSPGPEIAFDEWKPAVWGEAPRWDSAAQAAEADELLRGHWNGCSARVRQGEDPPEHLAPLLWLPEDPMAEHPDTLDVGRDWALGFYRGVDLRAEAWDAWLEKEDWIDEIFGLLERLATGEVLGEDESEPATPLTYRERLEITASLPAMLADLHEYRVGQSSPGARK
ncbi:MAG: UPF0149 family protein [Gammaproteobacteria bacterium]|nr:UPF0149 family protein [Gammaproteobacteria bacterium]